MNTCTYCGGKGTVHEWTSLPCPSCGGLNSPYRMQCSTCSMSGSVRRETEKTCAVCHGEGKVYAGYAPDQPSEPTRRPPIAGKMGGSGLLVIVGIVLYLWIQYDNARRAAGERSDVYQKQREAMDVEERARLGDAAFFSKITGMSEKRYLIRHREASSVCKALPAAQQSDCMWANLCDKSLDEVRKTFATGVTACQRRDAPMSADEYYECVRDAHDCNRLWWKLQDLVSDDPRSK